MIKLAIDAMGGDFAPDIVVKGSMMAIKKYDDIELTLYGDEEKIKPLLTSSERIMIVHAPRQIDMGEKDPISEIRRNKDTSMVMSFSAVKNKEADGAVTAGPTQGAIVAAHIVVRRIRGMKRVALCPNVPSFRPGGGIMLDVGANTDIKAEHMLQHAQFASIFFRETRGVERPKVGLLNIGSEPGKGRDLEKEVFKLLTDDESINFIGNLEPKELLTADVDIILTDGFTGNIAMKTFEGSAKAIGMGLKKQIKSSVFAMIGALFMKKALKRFKKQFSADEIGGANIFGVDGVIVKAHGSSNDYAFMNAINQARVIVKANVVEKMKEIIALNPLSEEE
ncbi:MAG TPA: phosphate acyltransferase PlsX [Bacilli bacterium]|nr:phosphate acyltransferase PlsX [Bacilli bacterium]